MAEKRKYEIHKTPRGVLIWPHLNVADTKFNADGEFRTSLRILVSVFEQSGLKAMLDAEVEAALDKATSEGKPLSPAARAKAKAKGANFPYKTAFDKDGNVLEEYVDLVFKVKADGVDPKTNETYSNKPKQFDGKGKPINVSLNIGTESKISFTIFPWATAALGYGISLRPKAVQVLKLVTKGGADAEYYGFEEEEDSYSYSEDDLSNGDEGTDNTTTDDIGDDIPF